MSDPIKITWASKGLEHTIYDMADMPTSFKVTINSVEYDVTTDMAEEIWEGLKKINFTMYQSALMAFITGVVSKYL
jgi:hypothetical protein